MNFLDLVKLLADELDYPQPSTLQGSVSASVRRMKQHINRAYNYVWLQLEPSNEDSELQTSFTTVAGTESYVIPATLNMVEMLQVGNDDPVTILPWLEYQRYKSDIYFVAETGYPSCASYYARKIWIYPTPDSAYTVTVRGKKVLTELSADDDEPELRADFQRIIFEWALYFQMVYENNPMTQVQLTNAQQALQIAKNNSRNHIGDLPRRIHEDEANTTVSERWWYR